MKYNITPVAKPRMTRSDRWKQRPCVIRYWDFCDKCRDLEVAINNHDHVYFIVPMPKSWSKKKKESMNLKPHEQKPDIDNFLKALLDAIYKDDSHIYDISVTKLWGYEGRILVNEFQS